MRGEEVKLLTVEKKKIGKDYPQINEEIQNIKDFQINMKQDKREIKKLEKENEELKNKVDKLKSDNFKLGLRADQNPIQYIKTDTISHLKRIMIFLKKDKMKAVDIAAKLEAETTDTNECLRFLEKYKLVKSKKGVYWRE